MQLTHSSPRSGVLVIEIAGDLDRMNASSVTDYLHETVAADAQHLVLDMSRVGFFDSHGLSMLVKARREFGKAVQVRLIGAMENPWTSRVLQITGLDTLFPTHRDVNELLDALDRA